MDSSHTNDQQHAGSRGYLEGYYARLLSWSERDDLLQCLASLQLNTYCYAPKEDTQHRLHWRESYSRQWRQSFQQFCRSASGLNVSIIAGIAPGLDFNFDNTAYTGAGESDNDRLYHKAAEFLQDGARDVLILWDDIEEPVSTMPGGLSEGAAHADVVNRIADRLGRPLWTVPRVYAGEISDNHHYLEEFFRELHPQHTVLLCGDAIVASRVCQSDLASLAGAGPGTGGVRHRIVLWDNFYANDYCPRRLFTGPWTGREDINEYLLNPTGLPYTDQLLLDMAASTQIDSNRDKNWKQVLSRRGVPDVFLSIAPFLSEPCFGDWSIDEVYAELSSAESSRELDDAIEHCLWKWKSPLAREWYPFIMGLKHDLALMQGTLPTDRVLKTQTAALSKRLLGPVNSST